MSIKPSFSSDDKYFMWASEIFLFTFLESRTGKICPLKCLIISVEIGKSKSLLFVEVLWASSRQFSVVYSVVKSGSACDKEET